MRLFDHTERVDGGWIYYTGALSRAGRWLFAWSPLYEYGGKTRCLPLLDYAALLKSRITAKPRPLPSLAKHAALEVLVLSGRPRGIS